MKSPKKRISIAINEDVLERVMDLAKKSDRSVSQFINLVLRNWLQEGRNEETFL